MYVDEILLYENVQVYSVMSVRNELEKSVYCVHIYNCMYYVQVYSVMPVRDKLEKFEYLCSTVYMYTTEFFMYTGTLYSVCQYVMNKKSVNISVVYCVHVYNWMCYVEVFGVMSVRDE